MVTKSLPRPSVGGVHQDFMVVLGPQSARFPRVGGHFASDGLTFRVLRTADMEFLRREVTPGQVEVEVEANGHQGRYKIVCVHQDSGLTEYRDGHLVELAPTS